MVPTSSFVYRLTWDSTITFCTYQTLSLLWKYKTPPSIFAPFFSLVFRRVWCFVFHDGQCVVDWIDQDCHVPGNCFRKIGQRTYMSEFSGQGGPGNLCPHPDDVVYTDDPSDRLMVTFTVPTDDWTTYTVHGTCRHQTFLQPSSSVKNTFIFFTPTPYVLWFFFVNYSLIGYETLNARNGIQ